MPTRYLNIHGLAVGCEAESEELANDLIRPLKFFATQTGEAPANSVRVVVRQAAPRYGDLPQIEAQFSTPRNVVYRNGSLKVIDYFGRGITLQHLDRPLYEIISEDRNLLCEAFYLLMLSLLGQYCDRNALLRVHALAFAFRGKAVMMMIPQGGGKSTLARALLERDDVRLISDDDPIVARDGSVLPFPRALGILDEKSLATIPPQYVFSVDRMEFGRKYFVDCDYWGDRIQRDALPEAVLLTTRRVLNGPPSIARVPRRRALASLTRDAVVGIGLYQGLEFLFNHSSWEALSRVGLAGRRFLRAERLARRASTWQFTLSDDVAENCRVLNRFLSEMG